MSSSPVRIKFWGVRGSIPAPGPDTIRYGGNTSCVEVRADGEIIVLDAGTGIRPLGLSLAAEFATESISLTVLITHTHWDHIQGFPFFKPAWGSRNHIRLLGYEEADTSLIATLSGQMESPYFPVALKEMPGSIVIEELTDYAFTLGKVGVQATLANHPGHTVGYRLATSAGEILYLPDNETLDGRLMEFIADADVLIIDAQFDDDECVTHRGWGHGCLSEVVHHAIESRVKKLVLFHHDPDHNDTRIGAMEEKARAIATTLGASITIEAAREGMEIILG